MTRISASSYGLEEGSVLAGAQVAVRYNAIPDAQWYGESREAGPTSWLGRVHARLDTSPEACRYVEPLASFYSDVTIPFTRREQLPVSAVVELGGQEPHLVEIDIAPIKTMWEGTEVESVTAVRVVAEFTEALALFESGHIVYSPSFLLRPTPGLAPVHVSALTSLVGTPSSGYGQSHDGLRSRIRFGLVGSGVSSEEGGATDLVGFLNERLSLVAAPDSRDNVFADLIRPVLKEAGWSDEQRDRARRSISGMGWANIRSASVEVVGARRYEEIVSWCRAAGSRKLWASRGKRAVAALGQNILDVDNQDEAEVADSLSQALILQNEVLLIHPNTTLRYSRRSRPFEKMRALIGGCPYFMLTNVVLAYNEYLLDKSAGLVDRIQQALHKPGWAKANGKTDIGITAKDLDDRVELFEHQTLHVLPNIFRYPTERAMFDEIVRQRGLDQRAEWIDRFTRRLYELREDITDLAERRGTRRTNRFLLALSVLQGSGLFLSGIVGFEQLRLPAWAAQGMWLFLVSGLVVTVALGVYFGWRAFKNR